MNTKSEHSRSIWGKEFKSWEQSNSVILKIKKLKTKEIKGFAQCHAIICMS